MIFKIGYILFLKIISENKSSYEILDNTLYPQLT